MEGLLTSAEKGQASDGPEWIESFRAQLPLLIFGNFRFLFFLTARKSFLILIVIFIRDPK